MKKYNMKFIFMKKNIYLLLILLILFFLIYCFTNLNKNNYLILTEGLDMDKAKNKIKNAISSGKEKINSGKEKINSGKLSFNKNKKKTGNYGCEGGYHDLRGWWNRCKKANKFNSKVKCVTKSFAGNQYTYAPKHCTCLDKKYKSQTIARNKELSYIGCKIDEKCSNNKFVFKCFDHQEVNNGDALDWIDYEEHDYQHNAECFPVRNTGLIGKIKNAVGLGGSKTCDEPSYNLKMANEKKENM